MQGDRIPAHVLSVQYIPHADSALLRSLQGRAGCSSLGIITLDSDDVGYTALDEATKKADVKVIYAKSMYAGAGNASTRLAGEFIGILGGPDPEEVRSGMQAAVNFIENKASFWSANEDDSVIYYAQCISRCGTYLAEEAQIEPGGSLAYLIAPPCEALRGLDAALKAADVQLQRFYGPPSETNFGGALLTGDQAACAAACAAFAAQVCRVAAQPVQE